MTVKMPISVDCKRTDVKRKTLAGVISFILSASVSAVEPSSVVIKPAKNIDPIAAAIEAATAAANAAAQAAKAAADAAGMAAKAHQQQQTQLQGSGEASSAGSITGSLLLNTPGMDLENREYVDTNKFSLPSLFGIDRISVSVPTKTIDLGLGEEWADIVSPIKVIDVLDLAGSTQAAMDFSRDVQIAITRVNQAEAQSNQARGFLLPNLSVRLNGGPETSSPGSISDVNTGNPLKSSSHTRYDFNATLRQPILDLPSIYDWIRRGKVEQSRKENQRGAEADAWLIATQTYLSLSSSRLLAALAVDYEKQLDDLKQYVEKRVNAGASSGSDMQRARARSLTARSARLEQEGIHASAGVEFVRLTNVAPQQIRLPVKSDVGNVPDIMDEAIQVALSNNPDIAALQHDLESASLDKKVATSRFAPRFDVELSRYHTNNAGGESGLQEDTRYMLVMNMNILNGGADYYLREERKAKFEETRYRLDDMRRRLIKDLSAQYAILDSTKSRLVAGYREMKALTTAAKAMSEKMFAGNQSLLDLLDVYDRLYQSKVKLVNLHMQEISSAAQIWRLINGLPMPIEGGPTDATNLTDVNPAPSTDGAVQVDNSQSPTAQTEQPKNPADNLPTLDSGAEHVDRK